MIFHCRSKQHRMIDHFDGWFCLKFINNTVAGNAYKIVHNTLEKCVILRVKTCKFEPRRSFLIYCFYVFLKNKTLYIIIINFSIHNFVLTAGWIRLCTIRRFNSWNIHWSRTRWYMDLWSTISMWCAIQKCQRYC